MIMSSSKQRGGISVSAIVIAGLSVFMVLFAGLAVWAYINYTDQKNNVDAKISKAVATAEKKQADELEAKFDQREKEPLRSFAGPSDYGTLGFRFPKTWSVYINNDGAESKGFEAFLNPGTVPSAENDASRYATRVVITNETYEDVVKEYQDLVEEGKLRSSPVKIGDQTGTRLDGNFTKDIRGAAILFKIRDKTALIQTDADSFKADFDKLIQTVTYVK